MASTSNVDVWNRALGRLGSDFIIQGEDDTSFEAEICRRNFEDVVAEVLEQLPWAFARKQAQLLDVGSQSVTRTYDAALSDTRFAIGLSFSYSSQVSVTKAGATLVQGTDYTVTPEDESVGQLAEVVLAVALTGGESIVITVTVTRVGWEYVYAIPDDCVTPIALLGEGVKHALTPVDDRVPFEVMSNDAGDGLLLCVDHEQSTDFEVLEYISRRVQVRMWPKSFLGAVCWRLAAEVAMPLKKDEATRQRCLTMFRVAVEEARVSHRRTGSAGPAPLTPTLAARR